MKSHLSLSITTLRSRSMKTLQQRLMSDKTLPSHSHWLMETTWQITFRLPLRSSLPPIQKRIDHRFFTNSLTVRNDFCILMLSKRRYYWYPRAICHYLIPPRLHFNLRQMLLLCVHVCVWWTADAIPIAWLGTGNYDRYLYTWYNSKVCKLSL